jgi:hypothetical protein
VLSDAIVERELAKQEVRTTTNELRQELRREAHERERQLLSDAEQRVDRAAERDFEALLKEILGVLGAPGRSGSTCSNGSSRGPTQSIGTQGPLVHDGLPQRARPAVCEAQSRPIDSSIQA